VTETLPSQITVRLPALSIPIRGAVWAAVPGSSLTFTFALQADPPEVNLENSCDRIER